MEAFPPPNGSQPKPTHVENWPSGVGEREDAVVVEQGLLDILIERQLAAKLECVAALVPTQHVADGVEIRARHRPRNRLTQREVTADGELRERRRSLNLEFRTEI